MGPEHFDAVKVLIDMAVPAGVTVHDTDASAVAGKGGAYPYIVLSGGIPRQYSDAIGGCRDEATTLIRVTHVALDPGAVRTLIRATRGALEQARPVIAGRSSWELSIEDSQGVEVDREIKIVNGTATAFPFYGVDIYRVGSTVSIE